MVENRVRQLAFYFDGTDTSDLPWEEATDAVVERPELSLGKRQANTLAIRFALLDSLGWPDDDFAGDLAAIQASQPRAALEP